MKSYLFALSGIACAAMLGACGKSPSPQAPAIAPTELAALQTPPPEYPIELACAGIGGKTVMNVTIGTEGRPTEVKLVSSSGQSALDESAQRKVVEWKFKPATRNGHAIAQTIQVPVDFKVPQPKPDSCFAIEERLRRASTPASSEPTTSARTLAACLKFLRKMSGPPFSSPWLPDWPPA
jgi:protein TonB